jgi:hypothetical protein
MGVQMEWCCGHFAEGNGSLYAGQNRDEDSRPQKNREEVEDMEDNSNAASVFRSFEYS